MGGDFHVLLANKNKSLLDSLANYVRCIPCLGKVLKIRDGLKVMEELQGQMRFGLAIIDLDLDGMSGWEIIANCRKDEKLRGQLFIVLSSEYEPWMMPKIFEMGISEFILTPLTQDRVEKKIKALLEDGGNETRFYFQVELLIQNGFLKEALKLLESSKIHRGPRYLNTKGVLLKSLGHMKEAMECFIRSSQISRSQYITPLEHLGEILESMNFYSQATEPFKTLAELDPVPERIVRLARVYLKAGEKEKARERAIGLRQDQRKDFGVQSDCAEIFEQAGYPEEAVECFKNMSQFGSSDPKNFEPLNQIAIRLSKIDPESKDDPMLKYMDAGRIYENILDHFPNDPHMLYNSGIHYARWAKDERVELAERRKRQTFAKARLEAAMKALDEVPDRMIREKLESQIRKAQQVVYLLGESLKKL